MDGTVTADIIRVNRSSASWTAPPACVWEMMHPGEFGASGTAVDTMFVFYSRSVSHYLPPLFDPFKFGVDALRLVPQVIQFF
jgi:hypothetical protein